MANNLWVIADIHGRDDLLEKLMEKLVIDERMDLGGNDTLVFTGDFVDRGPASSRVLERVKRLVNYPSVVALRGNHERLMLDACIETGRLSRNIEAQKLWYWNGGRETELSFPNQMVPKDVLHWVLSLPLFYYHDGFFFSHAPVPRESWRKVMNRGQWFTEEELTWTYDADEFGVARNFQKEPWPQVIGDCLAGADIHTGVCGHIHQLQRGVKEPRFYPHYIFADAGCGCSDKAPLCAVEVKSRRVIYVWPKDVE